CWRPIFPRSGEILSGCGRALKRHFVGTLRHTRYQAAVVRDGSILLLRCAFRDGPTVWILPGGGRDEGEDELACVTREVREETGLTVRVERLLFDVPARPTDGTYVRWRTYECAVLDGE